ncbi:hypothetical protein D3C75_692400 [compost metagenome]
MIQHLIIRDNKGIHYTQAGSIQTVHTAGDLRSSSIDLSGYRQTSCSQDAGSCR